MKSQVLYAVLCYISCGAAGEIWNWSLLGVKGLTFTLIMSWCCSEEEMSAGANPGGPFLKRRHHGGSRDDLGRDCWHAGLHEEVLPRACVWGGAEGRRELLRCDVLQQRVVRKHSRAEPQLRAEPAGVYDQQCEQAEPSGAWWVLPRGGEGGGMWGRGGTENCVHGKCSCHINWSLMRKQGEPSGNYLV